MKKEIVAVITGASSGIGRATALELASKGGHVVLAARFGAALNQVVEECEQQGGRALAVPTDVGVEEEVNTLAARAIEAFGRIDVWVNNAAVSLFGHFEEIPTPDIRQLMDTNVFGYMYGARAAVRQFKAQGHGTLINVSSMAAVAGQPYSVPYSMSKFAVRGMSISLAQELADQKDIHVCCVLPAVIDTPIFQHAANYMGQRINAPRPVIAPEKVAQAIVKLVKRPQEEVTVGNMARLMRAQRLLLPVSLFDKNLRKKIRKEHFKNEGSGPFQGNLYAPMTNWNSVNGGWRAEDSGKEAQKGKIATLATLVLAGIALLGWLKR